MEKNNAISWRESNQKTNHMTFEKDIYQLVGPFTFFLR